MDNKMLKNERKKMLKIWKSQYPLTIRTEKNFLSELPEGD